MGKSFPRMLHAEAVSAHPLRAPVWPLPICCCLALPGEEGTGVDPPPPPRHHRLLLMCQQTWESSGCAPDSHPHLPGVWGPTQREITFIRKRRNYKYEPKQGNEASVGLNRKSKLCPLLWASTHSGLSTYLSILAATESTSCLLNNQTFPSRIRRNPGILMLSLVCLINVTVQFWLGKKPKNKQPKNWTQQDGTVSQIPLKHNFSLKPPQAVSHTGGRATGTAEGSKARVGHLRLEVKVSLHFRTSLRSD